MSDNTLQMTMLFDFYGDMLTEKQRDYFDLYHNEDLSLSEIAAEHGISRQGVYDIISRAENTLQEFEDKTGAVRRWNKTQAQLKIALNLANKLQTLIAQDPQATKITKELVQTLTNLSED